MTLSDMLHWHAADRRRLWNQAVSVVAEGGRRVRAMVVQHQVDLGNHVLAQFGIEVHFSTTVRENRARHVAELARLNELLDEQQAALQLAVADVTRLEAEATAIYGGLNVAGAEGQFAAREAARLRVHLIELDQLLAGVGNSEASKACRRVVDVALGRIAEVAA